MTYNNAFADLFNFNQIFSTQRRNVEALSAANQAVIEGAQAISRRQSEVIRANVENALKVSKEVMTNGAPETNVARQTELTKAFLENTLENLREISDTASKSSFEAFDVLNKRVAESLEEVTNQTATATKTTAAKKKSA